MPLLLWAVAVSNIWGHGSLLWPPPRNAVDRNLPAWSGGKFPAGHYNCECTNATHGACDPGQVQCACCEKRMVFLCVCVFAFVPAFLINSARDCRELGMFVELVMFVFWFLCVNVYVPYVLCVVMCVCVCGWVVVGWYSTHVV